MMMKATQESWSPAMRSVMRLVTEVLIPKYREIARADLDRAGQILRAFIKRCEDKKAAKA